MFDERIRELARKYLGGHPNGEGRVRQQADEMRRLVYAHLPEHEGMRIALDALESMWALYLDQQLAQRKMLRQLGFDLPLDENTGVEPPPDFDERVAELARKYYPDDPDGENKVRQEVEHTVLFGYANLPKGEAMRIALNTVEVYAAMQFEGLAGTMVSPPGVGRFLGTAEKCRRQVRRRSS